MRASEIVRHLCRPVVACVDVRRLRVLLAIVDAVLASSRLSLTALGRALASDAAPKHRIKRVDRFLGNPHVWNERLLYYNALAGRLLGRSRRPVVLLDWTQLVGPYWALTAAIASVGRAVPIYNEVHPKARVSNREVQRAFLVTLSRILPVGSKPVIVADAGFKTPFFHIVREMEWDFVIRLRGRCSLKRAWPRVYLPFKRAFAMATTEARSLGDWIPYAGQHWWPYRIILGPKPSRSTRRRKVGYYQRRALEPWLLATTIQSELPKVIVDLYAKRMQIEETFRDTKNVRFGWSFDHSSSRSAERLELLLLVASLALAAALLAGAAAEERGLARRYQANTVRTQRVISLVRLGVYALLSATTELALRHVTTKRLLLAIYVQRPFQRALPFTRLRSGKWT